VQEVDASGTATFTSVFPGCYSGRWPHVHFEVYRALDDAVASGPIVKTSQIALPKEACESVYARGRVRDECAEPGGYEPQRGQRLR
jgi:protocatechuate 3,4-dioxygenase beta subunit